MRILDWDSDFFGRRIGTARLERTDDVSRVVTWARQEGLDLAYLEVPEARLPVVQAAIEAGAVIVDLRATLERTGPPPDEPAGRVRLADATDEERVLTAAERLSATSRFSADDRFPREQIVEMYRIWARACLAEGVVAVPGDAGPLAIAGLRGGSDGARVELVYVDPSAAGRGLGRNLLLKGLAALGTGTARVVTQVGNVPALSLYDSLGFRMRSVAAVLHLPVQRP